MFFTGMSLSKDHVKEGLNFHERGELEKAIMEYDQAIKLQPDFAVAYVKRGEALFAMGDFGAGLSSHID